ncbi:MAG: cytochrome c oxidase subunit II [Deltaproteobacteria bacterium]|nr:cytochrome c oxidase subunit II [Deltaproteobacteria bacterium]
MDTETGLQLFPERASSVAGDVDALFYFLVAVSVFFVLLIFGLIAYFVWRYRRRSPSDAPAAIHGHLGLELLWTGVPLVLAMFIFGWGAKLYFEVFRPPKEGLDFYVVGKQWMWKVQHPTGQREINEMHVPRGIPVKVTMTSEDVIHSFFVPAFRVKRDVVPGRFVTAWFMATKVGEYHLFCSQYCGTAHSQMTGKIVVLEPADYSAWLSGRSAEPPAVAGKKLFDKLGCATCHQQDASGRGPSLLGVFGSKVQLQGGGKVVADETYLRESVLSPQAKLVAGYEGIMPTFTGQVDEEKLLDLIAYIRSLALPPAPAPRQP